MSESNAEIDIKARISTIETVSRASGWVTNVFETDNSTDSAFFLYVYNAKTKDIRACSIVKSDFYQAALAMKDISLQHSVAGLVSLLKQKPENDNEIALALTSYLSKTMTYVQSQNGLIANHFVFINYSATGYIRPFALNRSDRFLMLPDDLFSSIDYVLAVDRKNHPEWQ